MLTTISDNTKEGTKRKAMKSGLKRRRFLWGVQDDESHLASVLSGGGDFPRGGVAGVSQ